jgi:hypothetical protein
MPDPKPGEIVYSEGGNVTIGAPIAKGKQEANPQK